MIDLSNLEEGNTNYFEMGKEPIYPDLSRQYTYEIRSWVSQNSSPSPMAAARRLSKYSK